jgi:hypothetical protein
MKTSKDEKSSSESEVEESETEEVDEPEAGPARGVKRSNPFFKPGSLLP